MPLTSTIGVYDFIPCNHSYRCLCYQCSWDKYRYDGQSPTVQERAECLKKLGRSCSMWGDEAARRKKRNERKRERARERARNATEAKD